MSIARDPVVIAFRRPMTVARKRRIHERVGGRCWFCGQMVAIGGPAVRYDHKLPLELGGSDDDANVFPLHTDPCDRIKTAADRKRIDKAKRLAGETCVGEPVRKLQGRGFDQRLTKGVNGKVRPRLQSRDRTDVG